MTETRGGEAVQLFDGVTSPRGVGVIPMSLLQERTGLEILQEMVAGHHPAPSISLALAFVLTGVSPGGAVFEGHPDARYLNPMGAVHGGWACAIADSALACAVMTTLERGEAYTSAEMKINFTRPITVSTGRVRCTGTVVHRGRTLAISEARLVDSGGKLLAFATETCSIFPAPPLEPSR